MWTTALLVDFFRKNHIGDNAYAFYVAREDAICLLKEEALWKVVFVERGVTKTLALAENEPQALNVLKLFVMESERGFK